MSKKLRVVIVSESSLEQINGVSGSVKRMVLHLEKAGHEVRIITPKPAPKHHQFSQSKVDTVDAWKVQGFNVAIPTKTAIIKNIKNGKRPDIIHVASPISRLGHGALLAGLQLEIPTVAIYQTDVAQYAKRFAAQTLDIVNAQNASWLRKIQAQAGQTAEQIVADRIALLHDKGTLTLAPTKPALARLVEFGVQSERIALWGRGVDTELFTPKRRQNPQVQQLRASWHQNNPKMVVGYVGRLAPEKQVERLAVLADLPIQLVIVGDGPEREKLENVLPPNTIFTGKLTGEVLANAYAGFDLFVHTGTEETFGQTLQEAMASGLPVIAPASGGPLDIVSQDETGILYEARDDTALHRAVEKLIAQPVLAQQMGEAGFTKVQSRTWQALGDELLQHYQQAIKQFHK